MIHVPEDDHPRPAKQRKTCPHCEATPAGCSSNHWLRARWCCEECPGDHDQETSR